MINPQAPGCFGLPSCFQPEGDTCKQCRFASACQAQASILLAEVEREVNCEAIHWKFEAQIVPRTNKPALKQAKQKTAVMTEYQIRLVTEMPAKVKPIAQAMFMKRIDLHKSLATRINPFDRHKPEFLRIPVQMLIEQGQFTKKQLQERYKQEYTHWQYSTMMSHATQAVQLLIGLKTAKEIDGVIVRC